MRPTSLLLGDEPRMVVPAARSLWCCGIPVLAVSLGPATPRLRSRAIRQLYSLTGQNPEESAIGRLVKIVIAEHVDWLLPTSDSALKLVADHYTQLSPLVRLACPGPAAILSVLNKESTLEAAVRCGISVPRTYRIKSLAELREQHGELRFPLIAKPATKRVAASFKLRYYTRWKELEREFLAAPEFGHNYILQDYETGDGIGIEVLMVDGNPKLLFAHRRLQEYPSTGGVSVVAISEQLYPDLVEKSVTLLRELEWEGLAMVEYRYHRESKHAALMEINGRVWGSIGLSAAAGINFPFAAWQAAHGEEITIVKYKPGVKARWTAGTVLRVHELFVNPRNDGMPRPSALRELLLVPRVFLPGTCDMLWAWDDPWPAIDELASTCRRVFCETVKALLRIALPGTVIRRLRTWRSLEKGARKIYAKGQIRRMIRRSQLKFVNPVRSAICICHGNIIRSPFAAAQLARAGLPCISAGLNAGPGTNADPRAIRIAGEFGVSLETHTSTAVTAEMIEGADAIFVMDGINEARLISQFPHAREKTFLLGSFSPKRLSQDEIADPYKGDDGAIRRCYDIISLCTAELVAYLGLVEPASRNR